MSRWRIVLIPAGALAAFGAALLWLQVHPVAMYKRAATPAASGALPAAPPSVLHAKKATASTAEMEAKQDVPQAASACSGQAGRFPASQAKKQRARRVRQLHGDECGTAGPRSEPAGGADAAGGPIHLDARSAAMARISPLPGSLPAPPVATFAAGAPGSELQLAQAREQAQSLKAKAPVTLAAAPPPSPPAQTTTAQSLDSSQPAFSQVASRRREGEGNSRAANPRTRVHPHRRAREAAQRPEHCFFGCRSQPHGGAGCGRRVIPERGRGIALDRGAGCVEREGGRGESAIAAGFAEPVCDTKCPAGAEPGAGKRSARHRTQR